MIRFELENKKIYISRNGVPLIYTSQWELSGKGSWASNMWINKLHLTNADKLIIAHYSEDPCMGKSESMQKEKEEVVSKRGERVNVIVYKSKNRLYFYLDE